MRNEVKYKYVTVVLFFVILGLFYSACSKKNQSEAEKNIPQLSDSNLVRLTPENIKIAEIKTEEVKLRKLNMVINFPGKVMPDENRVAKVGSRISGRVVQIKANLGDEVKKGITLAVIDSPELGEAESNYLKFKANLNVAEKGYERAKRLLTGKAIGLGEFQRREAEYLNVKAEFRASKEKLYLLGLGRDDMERLTSTHAINSQMAVRTSLSGTVVERNLTLGEVIEPSDQLFTIINLSRLWTIADVPEKDISLVMKGMKANIKVSAYPQKHFEGKITYISDIVDTATRMAKVRIEVNNPEKLLKPQMFAEIQILTESPSKVLAVPLKAVQAYDGKNIVFIAKSDNTFEKREIEVEQQIDGFYQVGTGLNLGDMVVANGAFYLKSEMLKAELEEE